MRPHLLTLTILICAGALAGFGAYRLEAQTVASLSSGNPRTESAQEILPPMPPGPARWSAHWIIAPEATTGTNLMFLARRSFEVRTVPERAVIYLTADTRYQLFVNGSFVSRGPARSAAHHQSYDALDVVRFLRPGKNALAVRFHHTGLTPPYHEVTRPGLLAQLELSRGGEVSTLVTDPQWKVMRDPSWDSDSPRITRWNDAYVDIVDFRKHIPGWMSPDFDDASWPAAVSIVPGGVAGSNGYEKIPGGLWWPPPPPDFVPHAVTPPWVALVKRDVPLLTETVVKATRLVLAGTREDPHARPVDSDRVRFDFTALPVLKLPPIGEQAIDRSGLGDDESYVRGTAPLVMRGGEGRSSFLVFDLGEVHNGHPRLDIEGPPGAIVDVLCTPFLLNQVFDPRVVGGSLNIDRLVLSGRRQQWEALSFKPARYLAIVLRGTTEPVRIHFAGVASIAYPWSRHGRFAARENPWLERFWQAGAKTIEVITTDAYTDNYRERRQYPQTSYYAAQGNYAAFGDTYLQRRYLIQNAEEQEPNGMIRAYAPISDGQAMPFLDEPIFWIMSWRDYLLYSGDFATTRRLLPNARRVMQRLAELAGSDSLIENPPYPYWIDHSYLDRRGANFILNALYVLTLDDYAETLDWLGERGGESCRRAAEAIRQTLRTKFWSPPRGLFTEALVEGKQSDRFSEHANSLAVAARIATPEQTRAILPKVLAPAPDLVPATSLFVYWTFYALCESGRGDDAVAMLEARFRHQLENGNGTLWEDWHLDLSNRTGVVQKMSRTDAQGECGIFPMALTRWVAGVRPVSPGMREVLVRRPSSSLQTIETVLPSPLGDLHVGWSTNDHGDELAVEVPPGMMVKVDLASVDLTGGRELWLDGRRIDPSDSRGPLFPIPEGAHRLTFRKH